MIFFCDFSFFFYKRNVWVVIPVYRGGALHWLGGPKSIRKNLKINVYRSTLWDFKQFWCGFSVWPIQISTNWCSG